MSQGTDVVWLKVSMSEPITALKLLSLKVYKTMSVIKGVHQLDHSWDSFFNMKWQQQFPCLREGVYYRWEFLREIKEMTEGGREDKVRVGFWI